MPANPKYLTASPWQRFVKISAAIPGGYLVTTCLHLALARWFDPVMVLITSTYSTFILWVGLMVLAFLAKDGWKVWVYYLIAAAVLGLLAYAGDNTPICIN